MHHTVFLLVWLSCVLTSCISTLLQHSTSLIQWAKGSRSILPRHVPLSLKQPHHYTTHPAVFPLCPLGSQHKTGTLLILNSAVLSLFLWRSVRYPCVTCSLVFCSLDLLVSHLRNRGKGIQPVWICISEEVPNCGGLPKWHLWKVGSWASCWFSCAHLSCPSLV